MPRNARRFMRLLIALSALALACPAWAVDLKTPTFRVQRDESLLQQEIRRNKAFPHLDMAYRLQGKGDIAGAVAELEKYLAADPVEDNVRAQYMSLLFDLGSNASAADEASRLIAGHPDTPALLVFRANALLRLDKRAEAAADLRRAASLPGMSPADVRELNLLLVDLDQARGDDRLALNDLRQAEAIGVDYQSALARGYLLSRLGDRPGSADAFEEAARLAAEPSAKTLALRAAADSAEAAGDRARAFKLLEAAGRGDAASDERLGNLALLLGKPNEAIERFKAAQRAGSASAAESLATVLADNGQAGEAADVLEARLAGVTDPAERERLLLALARTHERAGQDEAAAAAMAKALAAAPNADKALELSALYEKSGQPAKAASLLSDAERNGLPPDREREALVRLGYLRQSMKELDSAAAAFEQALRLAPGDQRVMTALAEVRLSQGYLRQRAGAYHEAAGIFDVALKAGGPAWPGRRQALLAAAECRLAAGESAAASATYLQALALEPKASPRRAQLLLGLSELARRSGDLRQAEEYLDQARLAAGTNPDTAAGMLENIAHAYASAQRHDKAAALFRQAIDAYGETPARLIGLGQSLLALGRADEARDAFARALAIEPSPQAELKISRVYGAQDKPGLALWHLRRADPAFAGLPPAERAAALSEMGYYLDQQGMYEEACARYAEAMAISPEPATACLLARAELSRGRPAAARETLEGLDLTGVPETLRATRLTTLARAASAQGDGAAAERRYAEALAQEPNADLWIELGGLRRDRGDAPGAEAAMAQGAAIRREPGTLAALGYAKLAVGQKPEARVLLEEAARGEPALLSIYEDLGYVAMQEYDNQAAVGWFKSAIDNQAMQPPYSKEEEERQILDNYRLRGEVTALERSWTADFYVTATFGETGSSRNVQAAGVETPNIARTSSGVEVAWIPPEIGFRDYRIFQVIGRLNWNLEPDSVEYQTDSLQGALGVRYKPFRSYDFNIGVERLFQLSRFGESNWLVRAMGGLADGADYKPLETLWNYSYLYGEVDAFLDSPTSVSLYLEGRQGLTWKAYEDVLVSPFLVADTRVWSRSLGDPVWEGPFRDSWNSDKPNDVSFLEGGLGLSLKYYYGATDYTIPRNWIELLMTYKWGRAYGSASLEDRDINALFATLIFHF